MSEHAIDRDQAIKFKCNGVNLNGILHFPRQVQALVLFVHGSGSSRLSPRNQYIAKKLQNIGIATFLFDLLTEEEDTIDEETREYRFDIDFLTVRLLHATHWVLHQMQDEKLPLGFFGASTGAAAALKAAAMMPEYIRAIVSRGGRPDLAGDALYDVKAATLLIVGGNDDVVIDLNQQAYEKLNCVKALEIVQGATHLFEEPGKSDEVAKLADDWFLKYLK